MKNRHNLTAVITKGTIAYVASCPELGVTSQGKTQKNAFKNLKEAVELYLEDEDVQKTLRKRQLKSAKVSPLIVSA